MKTMTSLLLMAAAAAAFAQNSDRGGRPDFRPRDGGPRVEGQYDATQRDGTVRRVLRLDRDGTVELVTEFRRKNDRNPRDGWIRMEDRDVERYGRLAEQAARGKTVRQTGRWTLRDGRLRLDFDRLDLALDRRDGEGRDSDRRRADDRAQDRGATLELDRRGDTFVVDRDTSLYGKDRITFRPDDGWNGGGRKPESGLGSVLYDRESLRIEGVDLQEGRDARLTIRAGTRRIEFSGNSHREGGQVVFRVPFLGRNGGEFRLRLEGNRVVDIRGSGALDRHQIRIED